MSDHGLGSLSLCERGVIGSTERGVDFFVLAQQHINEVHGGNLGKAETHWIDLGPVTVNELDPHVLYLYGRDKEGLELKFPAETVDPQTSSQP